METIATQAVAGLPVVLVPIALGLLFLLIIVLTAMVMINKGSKVNVKVGPWFSFTASSKASRKAPRKKGK